MSKYTRTMAEALKEVYIPEGNMDLMRKAAGGSAQDIKMKDGKLKIDMFTASAIMQIFEKVNKANQKKMETMINSGRKADIVKLSNFAMSKINSEYIPEEKHQVRQLKDPKKEMMIKSKDSGVFVIDKKDFKKYQKKGFFQVESVDLDELSIADVRKGTAKAKKRQGRERRATGKTSTSTADLAARIKAKEEVELDEGMKYTHVAVDKKGLVIGFASDEKDAKDMARRNDGKVIKLKKPMSDKKGDMMVNRPFKEEVELDEGTFKDIITMKKGNVGVGVIANAANVKKMEKDGWKIEGVIEKGSKILHKDPKRIMKAIKGGDKLNIGEDDKGPLATVDEGKMSQIDQMMKDGKSAKEIAKAMKMKVKDVESLMGEGFSSDGFESTNTVIEPLLEDFAQYVVQIVDPDTFDTQFTELVTLTT